MSDEDRISALHDDLLLKILSQLPTKDAVTTMVLSKRWGLVWTLISKLEYTDTSKEGEKSDWCLIYKSLQLNKAPVLESLRIQVDHQFYSDAYVRKCVSYAVVDRCARELALRLPSGPHNLLIPPTVFTAKTLVKLTLESNSLVLDVPSQPFLPSLQTLVLIYVVYKDQNAHVRLLSNCPALRHLDVFRVMSDNVTSFIVKVPSLKSFSYSRHAETSGISLVLDSPGLRRLSLCDLFGDHGSIQNMPLLDSCDVTRFGTYPYDNFLGSFSSVRILHLSLKDVTCCSGISFSRLIKFNLHLSCSDLSNCSLDPLMFFLHNSPILKELTIRYDVAFRSKDLPLLWNQQSSVPECLLSHLEIFVWEKFGGRRQEREFVEYILANSKCLKTARIYPRCSYNLEEKLVEELKSMYRVSASSQLETH